MISIAGVEGPDVPGIHKSSILPCSLAALRIDLRTVRAAIRPWCLVRSQDRRIGPIHLKIADPRLSSEKPRQGSSLPELNTFGLDQHSSARLRFRRQP